MTPVWRLKNGQGPSWKYAQAKIETEEDFQVKRKTLECKGENAFKVFGLSLFERQADKVTSLFFAAHVKPEFEEKYWGCNQENCRFNGLHSVFT